MTDDVTAASPAPEGGQPAAAPEATPAAPTMPPAQERPRAPDGKFAPAVDPEDDTAVMAAAWDRMHKDDAPDGDGEPLSSPPDGDGEPVAGEGSPDGEKPVSEAPKSPPPSELPQAVRDAWDKVPEEVKPAILSAHREMSRKLTDQGRMLQAVRPVQEALSKAIKDLPSMAKLTPAQAANDIFKAGRFVDALHRDPIRGVMALAQEFGALEMLVSYIRGEPIPQGAVQAHQERQRARMMQAQLAQAQDPALIEQRVRHSIEVDRAKETLTEFAREKPYWKEVEPHLAHYVMIVQQDKPGLSHKDTLAEAYDMAVHANPALRSKVQAAAATPPAPDPKRTADQLSAKSVNLPNPAKPSGKTRDMSEEEKMALIWERNHGK